jgi:hypothetical protein
MLTFRSRFTAIASMRRSKASDACWVQPTFACIVER